MSIVYIAYHQQFEGNISGKSCHRKVFIANEKLRGR